MRSQSSLPGGQSHQTTQAHTGARSRPNALTARAIVGLVSIVGGAIRAVVRIAPIGVRSGIIIAVVRLGCQSADDCASSKPAEEAIEVVVVAAAVVPTTIMPTVTTMPTIVAMPAVVAMPAMHAAAAHAMHAAAHATMRKPSVRHLLNVRSRRFRTGDGLEGLRGDHACKCHGDRQAHDCKRFHLLHHMPSLRLDGSDAIFVRAQSGGHGIVTEQVPHPGQAAR